MTGIEPLVGVVFGYLMPWVARKARRAGDRADGHIDKAIDATVDRLANLVLGKLGKDSSVIQLQQDAADGIESPRTRTRVELALEESMEQDEVFATALHELVEQLQGAKQRSEEQVVINATAHGWAQMPVQGTGTMTNTFGSRGMPDA